MPSEVSQNKSYPAYSWPDIQTQASNFHVFSLFFSRINTMEVSAVLKCISEGSSCSVAGCRAGPWLAFPGMSHRIKRTVKHLKPEKAAARSSQQQSKALLLQPCPSHKSQGDSRSSPRLSIPHFIFLWRLWWRRQ